MGSIAIEEIQSESFGYDFEDKQTRQELELIDDLQKLGVSKYLDLPQLVVVGDQSTGKSSVLQAVTEIPFSIDDNMCTRFATEIVLRRTSPNTETKVEIRIIPDPDETPERRKNLDLWRPELSDQLAGLDKLAMRSIFQQADNAIFSGFGHHMKRKISRLSLSTLRIIRSGPNETNFTIVDIPGLVRGNESHAEHRTAKSLVEKYLNNPRSIIVAVIDVIDLERHEIKNMLEVLPDVESRVIGVINKCDMKQKKSNDFVFDLIRNDPLKSPIYLKEGWFGLRNRNANETDISDDERDKLEAELFVGDEWRSLDKEMLGRHQLKKALIKMRNRHVKRIIPELMSEIQTKLDTCIFRINQLGKPRSTNQAQFSSVNGIATKYTEMSQGALNGHYKYLKNEAMFARKRIKDDLEAFQTAMTKYGLKEPFSTGFSDANIISNAEENQWPEKFKEITIYKWISATIRSYRGKEDPGEINPIVKGELWKQQTVSWKQIAEEALTKIERTVESVNRALLEDVCPDADLRLKLQTLLQKDLKAFDDAKEELQRLLENEQEADLFTLQPVRQERQQAYHDARVQAITEKFKIKNPQAAVPLGPNEPSRINPVPAGLIINSIIYKNPEVSGILSTHDSLAAYYDIAMYRFIDNFALQVVERHLLGPRGPLRLFNSDYVTQKLYGKENEERLNELAGENPVIAQERMELDAKRESLEESKKRVQSFKDF